MAHQLPEEDCEMCGKELRSSRPPSKLEIFTNNNVELTSICIDCRYERLKPCKYCYTMTHNYLTREEPVFYIGETYRTFVCIWCHDTDTPKEEYHTITVSVHHTD